MVILLSELVGARWWEALLHTHRTQRLRRHGGSDIAVVTVLWQLEAAHTADEQPEGPSDEEIGGGDEIRTHGRG